MWLLDTNVLSELRKGEKGKADRAVLDWQATVEVADTYVSVITIMELERGTLLMERRDPRQGQALRHWIERSVRRGFEGRIIPFDAEMATFCAALDVPDKRQTADAMIAATAAVHGMTVVTRNVSDFDGMGVPLLDPWSYDPRIE